jgi:hypothetical protein
VPRYAFHEDSSDRTLIRVDEETLRTDVWAEGAGGWRRFSMNPLAAPLTEMTEAEMQAAIGDGDLFAPSLNA